MDDRPSVTETYRGGVYELDRQTNHQKKGNISIQHITHQLLPCKPETDLCGKQSF